MRWSTGRAVPWLLADRVPGHDVVAGVTFGFGLLHQPTPQLGIAGLFAAWLTTALNRPVEGAVLQSARLRFQLGQSESSLVVAGSEDAVRAVLQRMEQLVSEPAGVELDESVFDRSKAYGNPLAGWRSHLAARWPGHRPHLSSLGPLALSTLDGDALRAFVADWVAPAARVYWTNEPWLADILDAPRGGGLREPPAPGRWRDARGRCLVVLDHASSLRRDLVH